MGHDDAAHTDAPNLQVSQRLAVHLGAINAALLSSSGVVDAGGERRDRDSVCPSARSPA
jgi:hypothetical protein